MTEISLSDILLAREERVRLQKEIIARYQCPIISFTMNIAGPQKNSALIQRAFNIGIEHLNSSICSEDILYKHVDSLNPTGPLAIFAIRNTPHVIKDICIQAEEETAIGRMFDMDVIDVSFNKISRDGERSCIVCGALGKSCAAGRLHPVDEIVSRMNQLMSSGVLEYDARRFSLLVKNCMIKEVRTTPKPGLVDLRNNGSHKDMTPETFERSAISLLDYFKECFIIGNRYNGGDYEELFFELRSAGVDAERVMYQATGGVNTHKGVIFSFGIICGALGYLWTPERPIPETEAILEVAGMIARQSITADLENPKGNTAGERIYISEGVTGIRGEASSGFKSVYAISLPVYRKLLNEGLSENEAGAIALLYLIANIDDTAIFNRGGIEGLYFAKEQAQSLLKKEKKPTMTSIETLDDTFIQKNLSAGGAADLLALTYFLYEIEKIRDEQN